MIAINLKIHELGYEAARDETETWFNEVLRQCEPADVGAEAEHGWAILARHPESSRLAVHCLQMGMEHHHSEAVQWWWPHAQPQILTHMGSLLAIAVKCRREDWVKDLINAGATVPEMSAALYSAARYGYLALVQELTPHVDQRQEESDALYIALTNRRWPVADFLIPHSDPNQIYALLLQNHQWEALDRISPYLSTAAQLEVLERGDSSQLPTLLHYRQTQTRLAHVNAIVPARPTSPRRRG